MLPVVPEQALGELGRTEGSPETLGLLVRDQHTRRLLLLRAVLDAAEAADPAVCPVEAKVRLREDWALLEEADRGARPGRPWSSAYPGAGAEGAVAAGGSTLSPVRTCLLHPLVGPWARQCLRGLAAGNGPRAQRDTREPSQDLAHFSALAAVAAARAGLSYAVRLRARDGALTLPSLGTLRTAVPGDTAVDVVHRRQSLTLRQPGETDVVVRLQSGFGAWSDAAAWTPAHALPGLLPGSDPVPLDDLDPYRTARGAPGHHTLSGPVTLDDAERKRWLHSWSGVASALRLGGEYRVTEAEALLRCLVPLSAPPGSIPGGRTTGSCSGTRREAFGAVLSSTPPSPTTFAATLVHELQHTKLAALSDMLTLHHAGPQARYFAPWRPDPRPYDGLLQGAYSHLALADFFQRRALVGTHPADRDSAWAQHARYREQVGAVLPALVGSGDLTGQGRRFVDQMVVVYERMAEHPAPRGQAARAAAYVRAARALWTQRHAPAE
ncbi:HEXXH motif-containing putative peptide modification protein [Streptomyces sp. NBC_01136]|uniref:aKG-HExxH-type peptide beta-hydroxylase n=1 Tax=unclassified Streptomyces TaxID=2593676 RepID=UPI003248F1F3|nr:HEXXH motif-containing putative peptide modification protein [Streptomyces sp. NBC_01136]